MAKSRNRSGRRVTPPFASAPALVVRVPSTNYGDLLRAIEDRRLSHPEVAPRPRVFSGTPARITVAPPSRAKVRAGVAARRVEKGLPAFPREQHVFAAPQKVLVCVRRAIRREVLHALKKTRSGAGRSPRRNRFSNVRC